MHWYMFFSNLYRVPVKNREKWMAIINSSYPEGEHPPDSRVMVCDLHFSTSDIIQKGEKRVLVAGTIPKIVHIPNVGHSDANVERENSFEEDLMMIDFSLNELSLSNENNK